MTAPQVSYMTAKSLQEKLSSTASDNVAVVDVRDEDRLGGHIKVSHHIPSMTFMRNPSAYVERFKSKEAVVFHCMYSQQRGPRAARAFATAIPLIMAATETFPSIYILDGGFQKFINTVGPDSSLLDKVDKELYGYFE